jgi:hypothetical protein
MYELKPTVIDRAHAAADRGDWTEAYGLLAEADAEAGLSGSDLAVLATTAYAAGHVDVTIDAWERLHVQALRAGDRLTAAGAAARVALHLLFDTALLAPIRGWIARAERLLDGYDGTPVHAWLAVVRSYERLLSGDFEAAQRSARLAVEVGTMCEPAAAAVGRVAEARSLILAGDVERGLELLNEAAVAAVSGEIDPLSTGVVYCDVVCALQAIAQYDLAEQWTEAMERWRQGRPVGSIHGRCRLHRAEILRLRGRCSEAEQEALTACEELRPYLRREFGWPLTELGRIRLRRGDLQGAEEALMAARDAGWDPQPGLAMLHLARGDVALALGSIRAALDNPLNVPSKELPPNTELRRAPLLEAQVEIEIAAGGVERARLAAEELAHIADTFKSAALTAAATMARARVRLTLRDSAGAAALFEDAVRRWGDIGAPYEAAVARRELADALRAEGRDAAAALELEAAHAAFARVGAVAAATQARDAIDGLRASERVRVTPPAAAAAVSTSVHESSSADVRQEQLFRREGDYWSVVFDGQTLRLRDAKGLRYLARLLACPGRELHALDLVLEEHHGHRDSGASRALRGASDAGALLDRRAKEAYARRLAEIDADLEEAHRTGDSSRAEQALAERAYLARELARAVGLGGRVRRAGSASERARASVTRAIRLAMTRVRAQHPALGVHLERAIRTGTYCVYLPDPRVCVMWTM